MQQIHNEAATNCCQSSGWHENKKLYKQRRKKKKDKIMNISNYYNILEKLSRPRMFRIKIVFTLMPTILSFLLLLILTNKSNSQLVVDHPKYRNNYHHNRYNSYDQDTHLLANYQPPISPPYALTNINEFLKESHQTKKSIDFNETTMPTTREKKNELLRKLSSTIILEALLRRPLLINNSPFHQTLTSANINNQTQSRYNNHTDNWPNNKNTTTINNISFNSKPKRIKINNNRKQRPVESSLASNAHESASLMDVSATNITMSNVTHKYTQKPYIISNNTNPEIFNASALNYLVDRLLSVKTTDNDKVTKRKRPFRQKDNSASSDTDPLSTLLKTNKPIVTLDMLIKDEYDLRVKPMLKSLTDQQRLSHLQNQFKETTTSLGPTNHKFDESASVFGATTITPPVKNHTTELTINNLLTTTPLPAKNPYSNGNTLISFEDLEDSEESEEEDYGDNNNNGDDEDENMPNRNSSLEYKSQKNKKQNVKKILQNVPPYQLNDSFTMLNVSKNLKSNTSPLDSLTTTNDPVTLEANNSVGNLYSEKATDASTRGSLVFSDGGYEAERAKLDKKRQEGNKNFSTNKYGMRNMNGSNQTNNQIKQQHINTTTNSNSNIDRTDSFLLEQLLSTVNPLTELDLRLKELYRKPELTPHNPLVYKGYVGKDDYLYSSTSREFSRPILTSTDGYNRYLFQTSTTPAPSTEPPSVPYNYFLHQPVTNAQSVPSMVIPTSGPFFETTTQSPILMSSEDAIRRKNVLQIPSLGPMHSQNANFYNNNNSRKYSYQLPDKNNNRFDISQRRVPNASIPTSKPILNESSSESGRIRDDTMPSLKTSWSPTKVYEDFDNSQSSNRTQPKRRQQQQNFSLNSSSHLLVPATRVNTIPVTNGTKKLNQTQEEKVMISDLSNIENGTDDYVANDTTPSTNAERHNNKATQKNILHLNNEANNINNNMSKFKFNSQRNKSKNSNFPSIEFNSSSGTDGSMNEENMNEQGDDDNNNNSYNGNKKIKIPLINSQQNLTNGNSESGDQLSGTDEESDDEDSPGDNSATVTYKNSYVIPNNSMINNSKSQNTKVQKVSDVKNIANQSRNRIKKIPPISHEPAESGISLSGLDKNLDFYSGRKRIINNNSTQKRPLPSISSDTRGDVSSTYTTPLSQTPNLSIPTSFSSTIIPNTNFFGEASSESPTLYNSISTLNSNNFNNKQLSTTSSPTLEDPYQRVLSSTLSTTLAPKLLITTPNLKQDDHTSSVSASGPSPVKPSTTKSNDRLYLILIGGSFAISVVCLVIAVMSMRCQDMCDDYRSLRNAERAAIKLQKHRLKYTKNHQINRFNQQNSTSDIGQSLIDENNNSNNNSIEAEINNMRNLKGSDNNSKNQEQAWISNGNFQSPFPAFINKELQACRCENCLNHRWLNHDDMVASNHKHMSWMNPHYYMQHQARLRPLFGAGSSVGTFFPRRLNEQAGYHNSSVGGSTDAQILTDNQPARQCFLIQPQRGITRTKSILLKNRKAQDINCDPLAANFACNNPEHHHNHVCHHHLMDPLSTSEESEVTLEESVHCDNSRCLNHQSNRIRMTPLRSNGHNNQTSAWKLGSARKNSQQENNHNHHHHHHQNQSTHSHHHHHHHQPVSSSDSSSIAQCTCSRDQQPLISANSRQQNKNRHPSKSDSRASIKHQTRRDKSMLVWSTNRDRLI